MKKNFAFIFGLLLVGSILDILTGCSGKKNNPVPVTTITIHGSYSMDASGYRQYDANNTTTHTATLSACAASGLYSFNDANKFVSTASCSSLQISAGTWTYNSTSKELIVQDASNKVVFDGTVGSLTDSGFVLDEKNQSGEVITFKR